MGPPLAAQGAQSEIYPIFSLPFGGHFWFILEVKNAQKSDAFFDGFVSGVFVVLGWILGPVLRIFWSFLGTFCDMAKTRKIARRVGESAKIEGWGDHKWRPNQKKSHRKQIPKLKREIIPKWTKNGSQMESKWSQKSIKKSMIFWLGFRTPLETSAELRGNFDEAAGVTLSPADPPGRRHIIKEYCRKTNKDGIACGIWHALGRWPGELFNCRKPMVRFGSVFK